MAFAKEQKEKYEDKYSLNNPNHKQIILDFEKEFGHKNFMEVLQQKKYFKFNDYYKEGYVDGDYIEELTDLSEKYKTLNKLIERRHYMENKEKESFEQIK
jgi:hypothetical protein